MNGGSGARVDGARAPGWAGPGPRVDGARAPGWMGPVLPGLYRCDYGNTPLSIRPRVGAARLVGIARVGAWTSRDVALLLLLLLFLLLSLLLWVPSRLTSVGCSLSAL